MAVETVATPDLPVLWWGFWLVVMAIGVFAALVWWLTREALREDATPPSTSDHARPGGPPPGGEEDRPAR